jgi:beta-galactosidase beta subunit
MKLIQTILIAISFVGLIYLTYHHFAKSKQEVVYIDTNILLENYDGMKAASAEYAKKAAEYQANVDTLFSALENDRLEIV